MQQRLVEIVIFVAAMVGSAGAQDSSCTYVRCALSFTNGEVVTGPPPATFRIAESSAQLLAGSSGAPGDHYRAGRHLGALAQALAIIGTGTGVTAALSYPSPNEKWTPANRVWLPAVTVTTFTLAVITGRLADERVRQAVWLYNRGVFGCPAAAKAACAYDEAALRIRQRMWSKSIVRGAQDSVIVRIGRRTPDVPLFAAGGDSATIEYAAFRRRHAERTVGDRITVGSLTGASAFYLGSYKNKTIHAIGASLAILGYMSGHHSLADRVETQNHLERAIWFHNAALASGR